MRKVMVGLTLVACQVDAPLVQEQTTQLVALPQPSIGGTPLLGRAQVAVDGPIDPDTAGLRARWIGLLPEGLSSCPQPSPGYSVGPLFGSNASPGLARYCLYKAIGPNPADLQVQQAPPGFVVKPDLQVLTSQARAGAVAALMDGPYQDLFEQQAEQLPPSGPPVGPLPRLVLLDSSPAPTGGAAPWDVVGFNTHGHALANMARNQGCDAAGACAAELRTRLALHLRKDPVTGDIVEDTVNGGDFGTIGFLASALHQEVEQWDVVPRGGPLILNLSVGWDPEWGGDPAQAATWHPAVHAMHDALYDAACRGALSFAAAGNRMGGPPPDDQPLYPAAWQAVDIEGARCVEISGRPPAPAVTVDKPIVWAVGGVDENGRDLILSRKDSRPRLMAFGSHAVTTDSAGDPTSILTGTSVSTLITSVSAAAVWSNLPALGPQDVVQTLVASGRPVGPVAPFWCPTGCGDAQWIDICDAVRHACDVGPTAGTCARATSPVVCDTSPTIIPAPPVLPLSLIAATTPDIHVTFTRANRHHPACGGMGMGLHFSSFALAPDPCPLEQYHTSRAEPWLNPQPMQEECPACFLEVGKGRLWIEWQQPVPVLQSVTLGVDKGGGVMDYWTTLQVPTSGYSVEYWVPLAVTAGAQRAWVTGTLSPTLSYSAGIQVLP